MLFFENPFFLFFLFWAILLFYYDFVGKVQSSGDKYDTLSKTWWFLGNHVTERALLLLKNYNIKLYVTGYAVLSQI